MRYPSALTDLWAITTGVLVLFSALAFAQSTTSSEPKGTVIKMSEREEAGLRGPVKTCTQETIYPSASDQARSFKTTTEYRLDGTRIQPSSAGQGDLTITTDEKGRRTKIEKFEPPAAPSEHNVAYGGPSWENSELPLARFPAGGSLTTVYNELGVPIEGQLRNSQGQLISRIVRTVDGNGKILCDRLVVDSPELLIPPELPAEYNDAQRKALGAFVAGHLNSGQVVYSYDSQDRLVRKEKRGGVLGLEISTISYNERGDKAEERTTSAQDPDFGREYSLNEDGTMLPTGKASAPTPQTEYVARYTYQYDGYGNWTEQAVSSRSNPDEPFAQVVSYRRVLTYY